MTRQLFLESCNVLDAGTGTRAIAFAGTTKRPAMSSSGTSTVATAVILTAIRSRRVSTTTCCSAWKRNHGSMPSL